MWLHMATSILSFASAVKVLQSFLDWSSSWTLSAQLTQQCLSFCLGFRVAFDKLMAELLVVASASSEILVLSSLNHEVLLWLGSRSAGWPRVTYSEGVAKGWKWTILQCAFGWLCPLHLFMAISEASSRYSKASPGVALKSRVVVQASMKTTLVSPFPQPFFP